MVPASDRPERDSPVSSSERIVRKREESLRTIMEQAPAAIVLFIGPDLIVDMPNQAFLDLIGKGPEIAGQPLQMVVPEADSQPFIQILAEVYATGTKFQSDAAQVYILRDGALHEHFFNITYTPLKTATGQVHAILEIAIDVTETVAARKKLEEVESRLRGAVELAELATWSIDPATWSVQYSERMKQWLGVSEGDRPVDAAVSALSPEDRSRIGQALRLAVDPQSGGEYNQEYTIINTQTGERRLIHAQGRTFFDSKGKPLRMLGTAQDITAQHNMQMALEQQVQQRTAQLDALNTELLARHQEIQHSNEELAALNQQLRQSNEDLQQFAHVASHDLKEPVRKIRLYSDRLLQDKKSELSSNGSFYLERIVQSTDRMIAMINGVLTYSSVNQTAQPIEEVSLQNTVDVVLQDLQERVADLQATVIYRQLPDIQGASILFYQLWYNLLINALKFVNPGDAPLITIVSRPTEYNGHAAACITVTDNGVGFDQRFAEQIFHPFSRLHSKDKFEGSGLGLSLCKRIVLRHGGTITATGMPGRGATFTLILPLQQSNQQL